MDKKYLIIGLIIGLTLGSLIGSSVVIYKVISMSKFDFYNVFEFDKGDICMDYETFSDRQMTLIYCDSVNCNCVEKARLWEQNGSIDYYNDSKCWSWFGDGL